MVRRANPGHMSDAARIAELGALLARGFRRLAQNQQNRLDDVAAAERPSRSAGEPREATKEVA